MRAAGTDQYGWLSTNCAGGARDLSGTTFKDYPHEDYVVDGGTYFRPDWTTDWPDAAHGCGFNSDCSVHGSTCLCNATVETTAVFTDEIPPAAEALSQLHIGAAPPDTFDTATYI